MQEDNLPLVTTAKKPVIHGADFGNVLPTHLDQPPPE